MMHAYDQLYLEKARTALGRMLDYAVYGLHYDMAAFFDEFLASGVADDFGSGDVTLLVGKSGVEIACEVLDRLGKPLERRLVAYAYATVRSPEYWTGWALAYYQWETALSFAEIVRYVPIADIRNLYSPYHEMDIRQFCDKMTGMYLAAKPETNLKLQRQRAGLSQRELSELSGVPLRTLQQYEQQQKNINKAQAEYLLAFARVLCCGVEQLLEPSVRF